MALVQAAARKWGGWVGGARACAHRAAGSEVGGWVDIVRTRCGPWSARWVGGFYFVASLALRGGWEGAKSWQMSVQSGHDPPTSAKTPPPGAPPRRRMGSRLTLVDPSVFSPYLRRIFGMVHYGRTFAYSEGPSPFFPALLG